ncbi:TPA: hypothetical protein DEF17_03745 [bacterium]|nr:MAG: hypothetical protein AUJ18_02310 [Candidatus Hydrogenedentes bacterium CG1_02_42_14]PIU47509.1 MAG: hypothetical protein COS94_06990 [Candidatus Hydrogenedentes bacterium CG07_land_8_20_14_0_80_42_17]HBW47029.1 hypothetical protein [bacterium]
MKKITDKKSSAGFSLIEVLVALAIVAIVSVSIIGSTVGMSMHAERYQEDIQLSFLLKALAGDIFLRGLPASKSASFDTHPDYTWRIEIRPLRFGEFEGITAPISKKEVLMTVIAPSGRTVSATMVI